MSIIVAIALRVSRVQIPAHGPFPIPYPLSLSHFVSCPLYICPIKLKGKNNKNKSLKKSIIHVMAKLKF